MLPDSIHNQGYQPVFIHLHQRLRCVCRRVVFNNIANVFAGDGINTADRVDLKNTAPICCNTYLPVQPCNRMQSPFADTSVYQILELHEADNMAHYYCNLY